MRWAHVAMVLLGCGASAPTVAPAAPVASTDPADAPPGFTIDGRVVHVLPRDRLPADVRAVLRLGAELERSFPRRGEGVSEETWIREVLHPFLDDLTERLAGFEQRVMQVANRSGAASADRLLVMLAAGRKWESVHRRFVSLARRTSPPSQVYEDAARVLAHRAGVAFAACAMTRAETLDQAVAYCRERAQVHALPRPDAPASWWYQSDGEEVRQW